MIYRKPRDDENRAFDRLAQHPLQSLAWGVFREKSGADVEKLVGFENEDMVSQLQMTFHDIPYLSRKIGYFPKGSWPDETMLAAAGELGRRKKAIFVKLEPNVSSPPKNRADIDGLRAFLLEQGCVEGRPMFTPYSFILDLTLDEEQMMKQMKSKTRYNVRLAHKHGVTVVEDNSQQAFDEYLALLEQTTKRQAFYAHTRQYQKNMWKVMHGAGIAHLLKASYQGQTLAIWILFAHNGKLYYPYGASSRDSNDKMPSYALMWEAMQLGKQLGCTSFDLWGALGPDADPHDPWYGFHRFKEGFGGELAEFVGSYDLVLDPPMYWLYRIADRWRWRWLRLKTRLPFLP